MPNTKKPALDRRHQVTGAQAVYTSLRDMIVKLKLAPGDGLEEQQLVTRFGVSRTPVREALIRLAAEGLVVMLPNRSAKVAPMNLADIKNHLEALDLLQPTVCHWAAIRRTADEMAAIDKCREIFEKAAKRHDADAMIDANFAFHDAIGAACQNDSIQMANGRVLIDQLRISRIAMTEQYFGTARAYSSHVDRIVREHREITHFIAERKAAEAEDAGRRHAGIGRDRISEYLSVSLAKNIRIQAPQ